MYLFSGARRLNALTLGQRVVQRTLDAGSILTRNSIYTHLEIAIKSLRKSVHFIEI